MTKKSHAEESGMPFEERATNALDGLNLIWNIVEELITSDQIYVASKLANCHEHLSESELSDKAKAIVLDTILQQVDHYEADGSELYRNTWREGLQKTISFWGDDACQEALERFKSLQHFK